MDDGAEINPLSVFQCDETIEGIQPIASLQQKLLRRYKYLQRILEEDELPKILKFLNGFSATNRRKLAMAFAFMLSYCKFECA